MRKESGYYPPGAEFDPRAPYNQKDLSADFEQIEKARANVGLAIDWLNEIDDSGILEELMDVPDLLDRAYRILKRVEEE